MKIPGLSTDELRASRFVRRSPTQSGSFACTATAGIAGSVTEPILRIPHPEYCLTAGFTVNPSWPYFIDSIGRGGAIRTPDPLRPRRFPSLRRKCCVFNMLHFNEMRAEC